MKTDGEAASAAGEGEKRYEERRQGDGKLTIKSWRSNCGGLPYQFPSLNEVD